jgi:hypothetical protein
MRCDRALEIDVAACLAGEREPSLDAFRAHYPECGDCAVEVRAWTAVHQALGAAHPEPARLLAFEDRPASLPPTVRRAVEAHLATCASCGEELRALRAAEAAGLARPAAAEAPFHPHVFRLRSRGHLLAGLRAVTWHPAFAYALVLLLLVPALRGARPAVDTPGGRLPAAAPVAQSPARELARETAAPAAAPREVPSRERARPAPPAEAAPDARPTAAAERRAARDEAVGPGIVAPPAAGAPAATAPATEAGAAPVAPTEGAPPPVVALRGGAASVAPARPRSGFVVLRVPLAARAQAGEVEVRVADERGRELRERRTSPGGLTLDVTIPSAWLVSGRYEVYLTGAATGWFEFVVP